MVQRFTIEIRDAERLTSREIGERVKGVIRPSDERLPSTLIVQVPVDGYVGEVLS